jgi:glycosyltransferase involved in cell wall biosynthesis
MRVLVNVLALSGPKTGVGHYTAQLLRCLQAQAAGDEIDAFPGRYLNQARVLWSRVRSGLERAVAPRPGALAVEEAPAEGVPDEGAGWRDQAVDYLRASSRFLLTRSFRSTARLGQYDLYHEPNFIPLPTDLPTVATLHDLSVLLHPEWHPRERVAHFEREFHRGLAQCVHFLAISDFGRQELLRTLGLRPDQVTRTYLGIRPELVPLPAWRVREGLRRLGLPSGYFLCLGTIEPRKNVLTLLRAYCDLPARVRSAHPLVLVGGWGWGAAEVADYLHGEARHRGVRHLGYADDADLAVLYNGAHALAYPSLYEGFGLPPAEMLACGGAVLASTAGAVAETVGTQAHLVEPLDVAGWRAALLRCADDRDWWLALRRGAPASVARFSWQQCAADTLRVFRNVCNEWSPRTIPAPSQAAA